MGKGGFLLKAGITGLVMSYLKFQHTKNAFSLEFDSFLVLKVCAFEQSY